MKTKKTILYLFFILIITIFISIGVSAQNNITYYCASDKTFTEDLDTKDIETCQRADEVFTGSLCCSEDDDPNEHYNDPGGIGGCFDKEFVQSGDLVLGRDDILNLNGEFFGCQLSQSDSILNRNDDHANQKLIPPENNLIKCSQGGSFFCSFNGTWQPANGDRSNPTTFPQSLDPLQQGECCSPSQCWNGEICLDNQNDDPTVSFLGFRCIEGNWTSAFSKISLLEGRAGFCPDNSQCLVSVIQDPNCISNGEFIDDNFCEQGNFTSRTKFIATFLRDIVGNNDFVIFCDNEENVLNTLIGVGNVGAESFFNAGNTNNFCVLLLQNQGPNEQPQVIFGTSLNAPLQEDDSFLDFLEISTCNNIVENDNNFNPCDSSDTVLYNDALQIIIHSNEPIPLRPGIDIFSKFSSFIRNPFKTIFRFILDNILNNLNDPQQDAFVEDLTRFDRLYLSSTRDGSLNKEIKGTIEGGDFSDKKMTIEYSNFATNICNIVDDFRDLTIVQFGLDSSIMECVVDNNIHFVFAQGNDNLNFNPDALWDDFTSKPLVIIFSPAAPPGCPVELR